MTTTRVFGIIGANGSGKDTIAKFLIDTHGFRKVSFAKPLKDIAAIAFDWDREMLEGITKESREWREKVDPFWQITPRSALQKIGNEMFRAHIANDIWLKRAQKEIQASDQPVVISDCRFPHEVEFIHSIGGKIIYVERYIAELAIPKWVRDLVPVATEEDWKKIREAGFHDSDTALYGLISKADFHIENNVTLEELELCLEKLDV